MRRLLKPDEVAEALGLKLDQVKALRLAGELPFIRISYRTIRFDPVDVEAFIRRRKQGGGAFRPTSLIAAGR